MSFGPSDISANDWAFSNANTFWTNWSTTSVNSGALNRPTAIACRWGSNTGATTSGHNNIWTPGSSRVAFSNGTSTAATGIGAYLNDGLSSTFWLGHTTYQGGMWRTASQNSTTPFRDGSGGNYAGKSADDANNGGGTTNWGGVGSPGGMGWSCTAVNTAVFVRKSGVWTECNVFKRKAGAWVQIVVNIRRSGGWAVVNWLRETGAHIPERGLPVEVSLDNGWTWEPGVLVEKEIGWFGTIDPTALGLDDWTAPGEYLNVPYPAPFTGRYNSVEPQEIAETRLFAHDQWKRALARGDFLDAGFWLMAFQPEVLPTMDQLRAGRIFPQHTTGQFESDPGIFIGGITRERLRNRISVDSGRLSSVR